MLKKIAAVMAALLLAAPAHAGVIRSPVSVTASSELGVAPFINTINQGGLNTGFASGITDFDTYVAANPLHSFLFPNSEGFTAGLAPQTLTYDMGSTFGIGRMAFWTAEEAGVATFDIAYSADNVLYTALGTGLSLPNHPNGADYPATLFSWAPVNARYVQLSITTCHDIGFSICGVGEVAFDTTDPVTTPEPASLALLGAGLAGLALARRRRG